MIPRLSVLGRAAAWTIAGVGGWLGYQLLVQNGRLLLRIEALEERLGMVTESPESDQHQPCRGCRLARLSSTSRCQRWLAAR